MKKTWLAVPAALALTAGAGYKLAAHAAWGPRYTLEETRQEELKKESLRLAPYADLPQEPYEVTGEDGYRIHAALVRAEKETDHYMILVHGYSVNRWGSLKYLSAYHDLGYHCIVYDQRGHGENAPVPCTYGIRESRDLLRVIEDARDRFGKDIVIGLHGESLGGATVITALRYHPDIRFAVADCPFAEIVPVLEVGMKNMHLPKACVRLADLACRPAFGYAFSKARPIDSFKDPAVRVPLCLMHGEADDFITPDHSERLLAAAGRDAELHLFPGAGHAESIQSDPAAYRAILKDFTDRWDPDRT